MARALILDAVAFSALAHAAAFSALAGAPALESASLAERSRALLQVAREQRALVRVPAAVLAEVCRVPRLDAAVERLLEDRGILVCALTRSIAQRAGGLLARAKLSSAHALSAFIVATALDFDTAVIATGDAAGIRRLAAAHRRLRVFAL